MTKDSVEAILKLRRALKPRDLHYTPQTQREPAEGGCGVIGIACSEKIAGRHLLQALDQMRNRGNGKGGGIAAVGLEANEFGVSEEILAQDYLLVVAYLESDCRTEVEQKYIFPIFDVDSSRRAPQIEDFHTLENIDIQPPDVYEYFVRVKTQVYIDTLQAMGKVSLTRRQVEDEIVYQNTYRLNKEFYASLGRTRAFVLSHGKNMLVLKMVGYGEDVVRYYQLEDVHAHVWIGHHRYPTKGRVWHPGGAHPFIGMNEALVHNGDFANYASISEYLAQRDIYPLFLTDTEVSVQVFDLLYRTYGYPLEYVIEALAPTTERDFAMLPPEKKTVYEMLQKTHIHCSPDGPWFFLIAQSDEEKGQPVYRLTGITDTSMLRPQVFAWQEAGDDGPAIGFAASEKQAIDAALLSLTRENPHFWRRADRYWNARGGSHTDGGAFIFSVTPQDGSSAGVVCTDKFGRRIRADIQRAPYPTSPALVRSQPNVNVFSADFSAETLSVMEDLLEEKTTKSSLGTEGLYRQHMAALFEWTVQRIPTWDYHHVHDFLSALLKTVPSDSGGMALDTLTALMDRRYPLGKLRRSSLLALFEEGLDGWLEAVRRLPSQVYLYDSLKAPLDTDGHPGQIAVIDAQDFPPEGESAVGCEIVRLYKKGYNTFVIVHSAGHRFIGNGLGADCGGVRIDVYGSSGDYLASGIDGPEIYVHNNAQDQLAQIMKAGKLVVYGDVGQTFGYAAKGGEVYILGNAAGRPMINAVGKPRIVINGTCLDYLAESFMAGDPNNGGGFIILNGLTLTDEGDIQYLDTPYPGGNLFSLASGGAIYVRDPNHLVSDDQLNGGEFVPFREKDWTLIQPYLQENERLFGIPVERLLETVGEERHPEDIYRKIAPVALRALQAEEAWVRKE
jgi:glutamate synthase domain-containing protein 1/glutamate synthase domain-containing protein 3